MCYMNLDTGETTFSEWQAMLWQRDGSSVRVFGEENHRGNHLEYSEVRAPYRGLCGRAVRVRLCRRPGYPGGAGARAVAR